MQEEKENIVPIGFKETLDLYNIISSISPRLSLDDIEHKVESTGFLIVKNNGLDLGKNPVKPKFYLISICQDGSAERTINSDTANLNSQSLLFLTPRHVINKITVKPVLISGSVTYFSPNSFY